MAKNNERRNLASRRRLARRWLESGVSAREFCAENGVGLSSLSRWARELRTEQRQLASGFVEVGRIEQAAPAAPLSPSSISVRIALGSLTLEFDELPPVEYVAALGGLSC